MWGINKSDIGEKLVSITNNNKNTTIYYAGGGSMVNTQRSADPCGGTAPHGRPDPPPSYPGTYTKQKMSMFFGREKNRFIIKNYYCLINHGIILFCFSVISYSI